MPETTDKATPPEPQPSKLRDILTLIRLPNLFTVTADTLMGLCLVYATNNLEFLEGTSNLPIISTIPWQSLLLVLASVCFYAGGVVLNDRFDYKLDCKERPERPLPTGRILPTFATFLGAGLLFAGLGFALITASNIESQNSYPIVLSPLMLFAYLLVGCILAYNGWLKSTRSGPIAMGACRSLNLAMAMSTAGHGSSIEWSIIIGLGVYVAGITRLARDEADHPREYDLIGGTMTMVLGLVFMSVIIPAYVSASVVGGGSFFGMAFIMLTEAEKTRLLLAFSVLIGLTLFRCIPVIVDPRPEKVRRAVGSSILMLIVIDAFLILSLADPRWGVGVFLLLIPAVWTRRFVSPT